MLHASMYRHVLIIHMLLFCCSFSLSMAFHSFFWLPLSLSSHHVSPIVPLFSLLLLSLECHCVYRNTFDSVRPSTHHIFFTWNRKYLQNYCCCVSGDSIAARTWALATFCCLSICSFARAPSLSPSLSVASLSHFSSDIHIEARGARFECALVSLFTRNDAFVWLYIIYVSVFIFGSILLSLLLFIGLVCSFMRVLDCKRCDKVKRMSWDIYKRKTSKRGKN